MNCQNISFDVLLFYGKVVARGDLGVEIEAWDVPAEQKRAIHLANKASKPVIVGQCKCFVVFVDICHLMHSCIPFSLFVISHSNAW